MKLAADKIFINDKAYTMEAEGVCKEAIVIKDGKFAYVGTNEEKWCTISLELISPNINFKINGELITDYEIK